MHCATKELDIRALQPLRADLLVRKPLNVLDQMQPRHQPRRKAGAACVFGVEIAERFVEARPVDQAGKAGQRMMQVDHVGKPVAEQVEIVTGIFGQLCRAHRRLQGQSA